MKNEITQQLNNLNFKDMYEDFISYIDVSELTLKSYGDGIKNFLNYLKDNGIKNPSRDDVRDYRDVLNSTKSVNTVNSYLCSLRVFFNYLESKELYPNITKDVKNIKTSKIPKKQVLSVEQCKDIYNALTDKREKVIFSLAISTGLRASEIANAKLDNIKKLNGEYVLYVKCKKRDDESEYVKLSNQVLKDILEYTDGRINGYLFVSESHNSYGQGLSTTSIRNIVKSIFRRFGYDEDGFSCHSIRRSTATIMYDNGQSIYDIQQVLHHRSIQTTQRYINQAVRDNNKSEYLVSDLLFN
jgi:site-specific recombinase XerD